MALFALPLLIPAHSLPIGFPQIALAPAVIAAITLILAIVARFTAPHTWLEETSLVLYLLTLLTVGVVVVNDGLSALSIALLALASLPAGFFRGTGILLAVLLVDGMLAYDLATRGMASESPATAMMTLNLPIILGVILFFRTESVSAEATTEDLSYYKLASQLSEVSGKSDIIINAIADGVVALDGKGTIQLINPAAQRILGWTRQDALSLSYKSIFKLVNAKNEEIDSIADPIQRVMSTNTQETTNTLSLLTHSGKKILASLTVSPVGQTGSGVLVVFRDITNERAEERQQAEFISTASHEMRTPVASIEGYLGLALNPATATIDEKARDFVTKAHAAAQHLGRLFQDLLDVTRAEDGRLANSPKVVDVAPFVQEIFDGLQPKAAEKNLRYIFKPSLEDTMPRTQRDRLGSRSLTPVYYANVDNDHLREVVGNLIENAIKYTLAGEVVVDIGGTDDKIVISITDSGIGIPAEDMPHLFQKFYRVDNSETREIGGTGLGLYLCRRLAEAMGGRVWVESEFKKGSTFHLEIPRIDHNEATKLIEAAALRANEIDADTPLESDDPSHQTGFLAQEPTAPLQTAAPQPAPSLAAPPPYPIAATTTAAPQQPAPPAPTSFTPQRPDTLPPIRPAPRPNTPLSAIESDPSRFLQHRSSMVNPRSGSNHNQ